MCFLCLVYTYFRIPEPAGRTFAELDLLFEKRISARQFSSTHIDVFAETAGIGMVQKYQDQVSIAQLESRGRV